VIINLYEVLHHSHIVIICDFLGVQYSIELVLELIECLLDSEGRIKLGVDLSCVVHCHAYQVLESFEFFLNDMRVEIILLYRALLSENH
jgi:hypothetical protein